MLAILAALTMLVVWAVTSGGGAGGGGDTDKNAHSDGKGGGPAPSIGPGPSSSGPAISERPGGRDESEDEDEDDDAGADGGGAGSRTGGGDGGPAGAAGGGDSPGGGGGAQPGAALPNCTAGSVQLKLRVTKDSYRPGEKPEFELVAENSAGHDCKVDFGTAKAVITIGEAGGGEPIWTSSDCSVDGAQFLLQVPAQGQSKQAVEWNRRPSAPECATPAPAPVGKGTYRVEVKVAGFPTVRKSFALEGD